MRPVCLVTGATGALGPAVVAALSISHDVRTLSRRPPREGLFAAPVTVFTGDIADPPAVRRAVAGSDVIVHMAALLHIANPTPEVRLEYERVNVQGTGVVMDAATSEGVSRVVLLSTIAVYGCTGGAVLNENSEARPDTLYRETKLAAERIVLDARGSGGALMSTVLRSAAVYGPRMKGHYRKLVEAIRSRRFVPLGPGTNRRTLVFEDDLAFAIELAIRHPAAAGRIYNVSDGRFHCMREIIAAICRALGRRPPSWYIPVAPVRLLSTAAGAFDHRVRAMLDTYLEDVAVDATRIQTELRFAPQFDLERGWATTIREIRRRDSHVVRRLRAR